MLSFLAQMPIPIPDANAFGGGVSGSVIVLLIALAIYYVKGKLDSKEKKNERKDTHQQAMENAEVVSRIDFAKLGAEQVKAVGSQLQELVGIFKNLYNDERAAHEKTKEAFAEKVEDIEKRFQTQLNDLSKKVEETADDRDNQKLLVLQIEQQQRVFCDNLKIAYWAITPDGHLEGNYTFFEDLTGLAADDCHNDGWFESIEETSRDRTKQMWRQFLQNYATRPQFTFEFVNKKTGNRTKTRVYCVPMVLEGQKVYKFTAQTAPLQLADA